MHTCLISYDRLTPVETERMVISRHLPWVEVEAGAWLTKSDDLNASGKEPNKSI